MSHTVDRREALRRLAMGGVGAATMPAWVVQLGAVAERTAERHKHQAATAAATAWKPTILDTHENETVIVLSELIIPETDTPGAKAAKVNEFADAVLADAAQSERQTFRRGLKWLDDRSKEIFGPTFVDCAPEQQTALLTILASPNNTSTEDQMGVDFFRAIKGLTITGYYTSEIGMKTELGDDGTRFFAEFPGCTHKEHK